MTAPVPPDVLRRVRKLAQLPGEARESRLAVSVTRLTVLKALCREPGAAARFVTHLARKVLDGLGRGTGRSARTPGATDRAHRGMMSEALAGLEAWQQDPTEELRRNLRDLLRRVRAEQDEHKNIPWGAVRLVTDRDLLLFERALECVLGPPGESGTWAYQMARDYAERYDPGHGTGLTPASAPALQVIADYWTGEYGPDAASAGAPPASLRRATPPAAEGPDPASPKRARFTHRQGQFLAFIHTYRRLHRRGPAEQDMIKFFRVSPPAVHGTIVKLVQLGLVAREPGVPRSVRVAVPEDQIPALEVVEGPAW